MFHNSHGRTKVELNIIQPEPVPMVQGESSDPCAPALGCPGQPGPRQPGGKPRSPVGAWQIFWQHLCSGRGFVETKASKARPSCPSRLPGGRISMETIRECICPSHFPREGVCSGSAGPGPGTFRGGGGTSHTSSSLPRQKPRLGPPAHAEDRKEVSRCSP